MEKLKHIGAKVPSDLYDKIKIDADFRGVGLSEVVRTRLTEVYSGESAESDQADIPYENGVHPVHAVFSAQLVEKDKQLSEKDRQIEEKDRQISELHQLLALKEKNLGQMTGQLERAQLALEDLRSTHARSWWQKLTGK